ncbi:AraC family transcriptional regulator [Roseimicrobium sp. ORNL1]|uniref:AraC family transcriptional regulator n=1 Tax=Roseimicrobium sp. ORNL1 TaxID=2711231 RepID=UPI001F1188D6|nr:AraC family transcriptional regulator [Roseimicrobium sp. ORNL1]
MTRLEGLAGSRIQRASDTPRLTISVSGVEAEPSSTEGKQPIKEPREFQKAFFKRMGLMQQFRMLFEHLPDTDFFAKDTEGRFVAIGEGMLRRIGATREEELLGVSDSTIHPPFVARAIRQDDLHVMQTRQPVIDRVEALYARTRAKDWFVTTKLPILDAHGEVIGVMGFVRPYHGGSGGGEDDEQLQKVVDHIHLHFRERLAVADLAQIAHLSERQLNRRFQKTYRMSTQEFIVRTRIQAASDELLATESSIAEVALNHGFYDQSAFTRQFRQHTGETPRTFRSRRRKTQSKLRTV